MYKKQLDTLLTNRLLTTQKIATAYAKQQELKEEIEDAELTIKIALQEDVANDPARYSNAEKRRVELENRLKNCQDLKAIYTKQKEINRKVLELECDDKKEKLKERYLFKEIDLLIAQVELKKAIGE